MGNWGLSRTQDTTLSLARGLWWLAGVVLAFVLALAAAATFLTFQFQSQVTRLTTFTDLDTLRQEFVPRLAETEYLLTEDEALDISARLKAMATKLAEFEEINADDPLVADATQSLSGVEEILSGVQMRSASARTSLAEIDQAIRYFQSESNARAAQLQNERAASTHVAEASEYEQRLLNSELLALSTSIFAATNILNEIGAISRYSNATNVPLSDITLSVKALPSACITVAPGDPPRRCTMSNKRVNSALQNLHTAPPEALLRHLSELRRSASAYIRSGERHFQFLAYSIETALDMNSLTRETLGASTDTLNALKELSDYLAQIEAEITTARAGAALDWSQLEKSLAQNLQRVHALTVQTADAGVSGRNSMNKVDLAYKDATAAWSAAVIDLRAVSDLRLQLETAVLQMNRVFQRISGDQQRGAQKTVGLVSSLALSAMFILALMGIGFVWGGQTFVVNPIEKTTRTILALSNGQAIEPVKFDRRSVGLGSLEKALESLRVANIEREALTQRTIEQGLEIERAHERLKTIANIAPIGLYEMSRTSDGSGHMMYYSDRFLEISGQARDAVGQGKTDAFGRVVEDDRDAVFKALETSARTLEPFKSRFRIHKPGTGIRWLSVVADARQDADTSVTWTGAVLDITTDVESEEALRKARREAEQVHAINEIQALHDGLTGLPNRRYFDNVFAERLTSSREEKPQSALLVRIDLDHFKYVNDTLGHEAGDLVLIRVSDSLRRVTRADDFAARIGGDEFSILMAPGTTYAEAEQVTDELRQALSEPLLYNGQPCRFGLSLGMAHTPDFDETGEDLNLFADSALYRAKALGRNRLEIFTPSLHEEILKNRRLASELHEALEHRQFEPFFQPQIRARTGELAGVEVLLRWKHPKDGILSPGLFLPVAEQMRVLADIDRQIMEQTRDAVARLHAKGIALPKVSLNVSSERMHDPGVIDLAKSIASDGTRISFELLESILIEEESDVFRFHLDQLREAGIDIEIDDFGSGRASILSLLESGASALKIDQRLIRPLETDTRSRELVRTIIEIADTLDIKTVAEGVETETQREYLVNLGCDVLQGYLFSQPVSEIELEEFYWGIANRQFAGLAE